MIGGCQGVTAWFLGLHDQGLTETVGIWLAEFYKFLILFYSDGHWITDFLSSKNVTQYIPHLCQNKITDFHLMSYWLQSFEGLFFFDKCASLCGVSYLVHKLLRPHYITYWSFL